MKKIILLIVLTGLFFAPGLSQVGTFKGRVTDSQDKALIGVSVVFTEEETTSFKQTLETKGF